MAEEDEAHTVRVFPENMETVKAYGRCQWEIEVAGMSGTIIYKGIAAQEIESACRLLRIPPGRWEEVSQGVRVMANAAGPVLNRKNRGGGGNDDDFHRTARARA